MTTVEAAVETGLSLELTRVIAAPKARVFDAWTRPEMIRRWFGPEGFTTPLVNTDPKPGGPYEIHMEGPKPGAGEVQRKSAVTGTYTKVNPFDLLQFTWSASWSADEVSLVTIHLRDVEGGTELRLVHERFASENSRNAHAQGWSGALVKLVATLEA